MPQSQRIDVPAAVSVTVERADHLPYPRKEVQMSGATLKELSRLVGGQFHGPAELIIENALPQQDARPGSITLADSASQALRANDTAAVAVVVDQAYAECNKPMLVVGDIHAAFARIITRLRPGAVWHPRLPTFGAEIAATAAVDDSAQLGEGTRICAGAVVESGCQIGRRCLIHPGAVLMEGCQLGDDCHVFPGSVLYPRTILGDRVLVHANVTLGAFGFGYRQVDGTHQRTAQLGWVEIADDVEIGAGSTIDRGTYGPTRIGTGTKIDNQVRSVTIAISAGTILSVPRWVSPAHARRATTS